MVVDRDKIWLEENVKFFGMVPRDYSQKMYNEIDEALQEDVDKYWNTPGEYCELHELIFNGSKCTDPQNIIPDTFKMNVSEQNGNVILTAMVHTYDEKTKDPLDTYMNIAALPLVCLGLMWRINGSYLTIRGSCTKDYTVPYWYSEKGKDPEKKIIKSGGSWTYNIETKEFNYIHYSYNSWDDVYEKMSNNTKKIVNAIYSRDEDTEISEQEFIDVLPQVADIEFDSILRFIFRHTNEYFDFLRESNLYCQAKYGKPLGVALQFIRMGKLKSNNDEKLFDTMLYCKEGNKVYSYQTHTEVVLRTDADKRLMEFNFHDAEYFFDAFKTSTSQSAGRHRLMLDNVYIDKYALYLLDKEGNALSMFDVVLNKNIHFDTDCSLSNYSLSMFCGNNAPKRIMMTAKVSAQSVPVRGCDNRNRVRARVLFADIEGLNFGDSILVRRKFAEEHLTHIGTSTINLASKTNQYYQYFRKKAESDDYELTHNELAMLYPFKSSALIENHSNMRVIRYQLGKHSMNVTIYYEMIPKCGDKITNFHGAKGTIGKFLDDDEMPRLVNDVTENFKAGPFDIIISGYSVARRGTFGQIFEAWARACDIEFPENEDTALNAVKLYRKEIEEFDNKVLVEYNGIQCKKPCGIIDIIRLEHHAAKQCSFSEIRNNKKMLKFGEMEKLHLAAHQMDNLLKELSYRSVHKYASSHHLIRDMQNKGVLRTDINPDLDFTILMKCLNLDFSYDDEDLYNLMDYYNECHDCVNSSTIDIFEDDDYDQDGDSYDNDDYDYGLED